MQLEPLIPQTPAQWFGLTIATILAALSGWWARRKREPVELEKMRAETQSIHIAAENAGVGAGLEAFREMQAVIVKAEQRREEWHLKEEQMRTQILFWRNKAEELDGSLIDSRDANAQLNARLKVKQDALDKCMVLMALNKVKFEEADHPEIKKLIERITLYLKTEDIDKTKEWRQNAVQPPQVQSE